MPTSFYLAGDLQDRAARALAQVLTAATRFRNASTWATAARDGNLRSPLAMTRTLARQVAGLPWPAPYIIQNWVHHFTFPDHGGSVAGTGRRDLGRDGVARAPQPHQPRRQDRRNVCGQRVV